jgi:hypothetical protein
VHRSILSRQVVPALLGYLGLIGATIAVDLLLHRADLLWIGSYLGPLGTALIALSFVYSLRKRKKISFGAPKRLLELHQTLSWIGALCILVHAGIHFTALIPWLAVLAMLVVVASGYTGTVLVKRATAILKSQEVPTAGVDNTVFDAMTLDVMKRWRVVHMPINAVFLALFGLHLGAVVLFWAW